MHCTLLIPRLFWPRESGDDVYRGITSRALETLLARSRGTSFAPISVEGWLCQAFEVERQRDWPVAPLTLAVDGGEPGDACWMRADPVHVEIRRDRMMLADAAAFRVTQPEASELVAALNRHFAADGLVFEARCPTRWYLGSARAPDMSTVELSEVAGGDASACLPAGPDALHWHRLWNEMQMVLHDHPVNTAREARGERVINSVWLWGGGAYPEIPARHFEAVWSSDALPVALAALADCNAAPLPSGASQWLAGPLSGARHLIVLDEAATAVRYGDAARWREVVSALEREWFAPLLAALRARRLSGLAIVVPDVSACRRFDLGPVDLLKFWRVVRPLTAYA